MLDVAGGRGKGGAMVKFSWLLYCEDVILNTPFSVLDIKARFMYLYLDSACD